AFDELYEAGRLRELVSKTDLATVVQETGSSTTSVMSQNAVTEAIDSAKTTVVQETGSSTTSVMSQNAVTKAIDSAKTTVVQETGTSTTSAMSQNAVTKAIEAESVYDLVIRTQAQFDEMIASEDWLGATFVAIVGSGRGEVDYTATSRIGIPDNVTAIYGIRKPWLKIESDTDDYTRLFAANADPADPTTWLCDVYDIKVTTETGSYAMGYLNSTIRCVGVAKYCGIQRVRNVQNCEADGTNRAYQLCGQNAGDVCYGLRPTAQHTASQILVNCSCRDIINDAVEITESGINIKAGVSVMSENSNVSVMSANSNVNVMDGLIAVLRVSSSKTLTSSWVNTSVAGSSAYVTVSTVETSAIQVKFNNATFALGTLGAITAPHHNGGACSGFTGFFTTSSFNVQCYGGGSAGSLWPSDGMTIYIYKTNTY
ncbi:MAG: hypothetical protein SNG97_06855, partial [Rikenellaceae bacterium]